MQPAHHARQRNQYRRRHRLSGRAAYSRVYEQGVRRATGPLAVRVLPNGLPYPRLGLSVPKRVGNAVRRNRIKRLIREAFRLSQHDWPRGYDVLMIVRPHRPATLADYQRLLFALVRKAHHTWEKMSSNHD